MENKVQKTNMILDYINDDTQSVTSLCRKYGYTFDQFRYYYKNFVNFGSISTARVKANDHGVIHIVGSKRYNKIIKGWGKIFSSAELGNIVHEAMFSGERLSSVLYKNKISYDQYYSALKELSTTGKLLGHRVIDYTKIGKHGVTNAIKLARAECGSHSFANRKWYKALTKKDLGYCRVVIKMLDMNL